MLSGRLQLQAEWLRWIDAEHMFLLREKRKAGTLEIDATVTEVMYNPVFPPDLFTFQPPPGAEER